MSGFCQDEELKQLREVVPIRIALFDQTDFPIAMPVLQLLFTRNGFLRRSKFFHVDQCVNDVLFDELRAKAAAMLIQSGRDVPGDADIKRAMFAAGEDAGAISRT